MTDEEFAALILINSVRTKTVKDIDGEEAGLIVTLVGRSHSLDADYYICFDNDRIIEEEAKYHKVFVNQWECRLDLRWAIVQNQIDTNANEWYPIKALIKEIEWED